MKAGLQDWEEVEPRAASSSITRRTILASLFNDELIQDVVDWAEEEPGDILVI